jgi:hypothetical protein
VFKGGTSLSKAHGVIERFSEDIDLTYDITAFIPDLAKETGGKPPTQSQANKWTDEIRKKLPEWVETVAIKSVSEALIAQGLAATLTANGDTLLIDYPAATGGTGYVKPQVVAEFGARSTGEPSQEVEIDCDAALALATLGFPSATVRAMAPERTFWEKATAVHVFCSGGRHRGRTAFARHWHDLVQLHRHGFAEAAILDRALGSAVAEHKAYFFREKDGAGGVIDYAASANGALNLVPGGARLDELRKDYENMIRDGLLEGDERSFDDLLAIIREIETLANTENPNLIE